MLTIRRKLIFYFIIPILAIGLLYFTISRYYTQKELLGTLEERANEESVRLANNIKDASLTNDRIPLTDIVLSEKYSNMHIKYITVFNAKGEVTAHTNLDKTTSNIFSDQSDVATISGYTDYEGISIFNIDRPIFSGLYKIGMVRVGFDFSDTINTFNYTAYWFLGIGSLFLVGITLFVFKISKHITQPIAELKEVATQFAQGNFTSRAHIISEDEAGELARAFNIMADAITTSKEQIENEKMVLQNKISELEKWQQATMGRELKMVQLKEELEKHREEKNGGTQG